MRSVALEFFMGHRATKLQLPERGIVVIVGENGEGKSSIVEGVSWAGWGKTLRGDHPWWDDARNQCLASVDADRVSMTRTRKGKANGCSFGVDGKLPETFETPTKASDALEEVLGPHDLWKRSHVFSSSDAAHFTLATDGERKRLIESFLGLDRFDPALKACRQDLQTALNRQGAAQRKQEVLITKLDSDRARLAEAKAALNAAPPRRELTEAKAGKPLTAWDADITKAKRDVADIERRIREADRAGTEHEAAMRSAKTMLDRLRADKCPTCARAITPDMRRAERVKVDRAAKLAQEAKDAAVAELGDAETILADLRAELDHLVKARAAREAELRVEQQARHEADRIESQKRVLKQTITAVTEAIAKAQRDLVEAEEELDLATTDVAELTEVEKVLGLKGFRANILGDSLAGIEAVANTWLARLRQGVTLELKPYSEKGPADAISLKTKGLGRGTYKSTSGGERRRVDVALLLGLGEVSTAARGVKPGTLWFDEVFDCLDEPGVEGVCEVLQELAQERCVVVITHSKPLIEKMRAARRLRIVRGTIVELG